MILPFIVTLVILAFPFLFDADPFAKDAFKKYLSESEREMNTQSHLMHAVFQESQLVSMCPQYNIVYVELLKKVVEIRNTDFVDYQPPRLEIFKAMKHLRDEMRMCLDKHTPSKN